MAPSDPATTDAHGYVTGQTAASIDISERLPLFIAAVIGLSFLLLMVVFRSLLVPLKAAIMNLLSIGAAYGAVVAVFQWGWGKGLDGLSGTARVITSAALIMISVFASFLLVPDI